MKTTENTGNFADRLSDLISKAAQNGITLRDIERATGVKKESISKYQNNKAEPGLNSIVALAKYFNVSADYLLGLSNVKSMDPEITAICKYTGLSEKALLSLKFRSAIVNVLLELDFEARLSDARKSLALEDMLFEREKKYTQVLTKIEDYIFMDDIDESICFAITKNGKLRATTDLKEEWSDRGVLTCEDAYDFYSAKTLRQSQIIEEMLLSEIRDNLKKCKRLVKEGRNNGNSN